MFERRTAVVVAGIALVALAAAGCNRGSSGGSGASGGTGGGKVGIDQPRSDSDFWNSYAKYIESGIKDLNIDALPRTNSQNQITQLASNVKTLVAQGAKAIVMAPQDTAAIAPTLDQLAAKKVPVVSVDTRPDTGKVYMVVRADNRAYGTKACEFLGTTLKGKGNVVEFQGALSSINGRDRSEAFKECMTKKYPDIKLFEIPTDWEGPKAAAGLNTVLAQTGNNIQGIYMQAGGVFLAPTLQVLQQKNLLVPPGDPKHIAIISNDGIKQELDAIKKGDIDATVSQPADAYAEWGLFYAKAAADGKAFQPGKTDHDSTIIALPNGLEDQLSAPLVTKAAGTFGEYTSVAAGDASLWGNNG
jgi:simple sugar transport system substrate-binding protein/ribose transport system substrate-binding protein